MEIIRDIKDENILVNLKTGNLAIIDFGSGCHANQDPLREFEGRHEYQSHICNSDKSGSIDGQAPTHIYCLWSGTHLYAPPEWLRTGQYKGEPATVWSLGGQIFVFVFSHVLF